VSDVAKKKDKCKRHDEQARAAGQNGGAGPLPRMKRGEYEGEMRVLHGELVAMQEWVRGSGAKVCVVFEGRDTAGKGGTIKRITERVSPRGILLLKYWLEVSAAEQTRRLESRIQDPRKIWKLSDMDLKSYSRWYDYSRARDAMFAATDTAWAPWFVADTDDKKRGRLNIISHLLSQVPYQPPAHRDIVLPKRQRPAGYTQPDLPLRHIPTPF
jgi:polyphosphate kinase